MNKKEYILGVAILAVATLAMLSVGVVNAFPLFIVAFVFCSIGFVRQVAEERRTRLTRSHWAFDVIAAVVIGGTLVFSLIVLAGGFR